MIRVAAPALALLSGCAAHLPRPDERAAFLEPSRVSVSTDRREAFEVEPAVHLLVWNGLDRADVAEQGGLATALSVSFLGDFRLLREASTPVRTPTYEPRAKLQVFHVAPPPADASVPGAGSRWLAALELTVGHRSNGEQGCALADHARTGKTDFACLPLTDPPSDRLNLSTGSFTTNYVGAGARMLERLAGGDGRPTAAVLAASAVLEWNVPCHLGACMPVEMRRRYGATVARGVVELELPAVWRVAGALPLVGAASELSARVTFAGSIHLGTVGRPAFGDASAEVAVVSRAPGSLGFGLFVGRHQGRDDLNIRFEERLDAWVVGIVLDPVRLDGALP